MKHDRFLITILIGIACIAIVSIVLFYSRRDDNQYSGENTPEGVIQDYVLALQKKEFEKAYEFLAEDVNKRKPEFDEFREFFITSIESYNRAGLTVGTSSITGDKAFVTVIIQRNYGGPFNDVSRSHETVDLVNQNGNWKIRGFAYPFWGHSWYEDTYKY